MWVGVIEYTLPMSPEPLNHDDRLDKLEETAGYSDRQIEILSGEVAQINRIMVELSRRFAHIESRLSELNDRVAEDPGNVPPPHSAGPDIPKEPL